MIYKKAKPGFYKLKALRDNLPDGEWVAEGWVEKYHRILEDFIESFNIEDYEIPEAELVFLDSNPSYIQGLAEARGVEYVPLPTEHRFIGKKTFLSTLHALYGFVEEQLKNEKEGAGAGKPLAHWATKDLSFIHDPQLRVILERDLQELAELNPDVQPKCVTVLCGGVSEGILLDALTVNLEAALATKAAKGRKRELTDWGWTLGVFIKVASEMDLVTPGTIKLLGDVVKDFRNLIHPGVEIREGYNIRPSEAKGALALLEGLIADLSS